MKIIVDAMGGDNAPEQIVLGAIDALCEDKQLEVTLVGDTDAICKVLAGKNTTIIVLKLSTPKTL